MLRGPPVGKHCSIALSIRCDSSSFAFLKTITAQASLSLHLMQMEQSPLSFSSIFHLSFHVSDLPSTNCHGDLFESGPHH